MEWTETRETFNYSSLLELTLRGHRLLPLLRYMKSCHKENGSTVLDFFQSQGQPDIAKSDLYMAYNVVDVFGLDLIMEQIIGAEDKQLVARMLLDYQQGKAVSGPADRLVPQRASPLGYTPSGIPLFEDNPKFFVRKQFDPSKIATEVPEIRTDASLFRTECLRFWEHDERVRLSRNISATYQSAEQIALPTAVYILPFPAEKDGLQQRKNELLKQLTDPTRTWLPETCARILKQEHPNMVVRAGWSRAEALIRQRISPIAATASPPPGIGAAPGFLEGSPLDLQIIPGASLPAARNIFNAFRQGQASGELLGEPTALPDPPIYISWHKICKKARAENLVKVKRGRGYEDPEQEAKKESEEQEAEEVRLNAARGLPSTIDHRDVWDPEGREYRRMSEATPVWNRPFLDIPRGRTSGGWMSMATETLKHVERAIATKERRMAKIRARNWRASKV